MKNFEIFFFVKKCLLLDQEGSKLLPILILILNFHLIMYCMQIICIRQEFLSCLHTNDIHIFLMHLHK